MFIQQIDSTEFSGVFYVYWPLMLVRVILGCFHGQLWEQPLSPYCPTLLLVYHVLCYHIQCK